MVVIYHQPNQMLVIYSQTYFVITYNLLNKLWFILGMRIALILPSEYLQIIALNPQHT